MFTKITNKILLCTIWRKKFALLQNVILLKWKVEKGERIKEKEEEKEEKEGKEEETKKEKKEAKVPCTGNYKNDNTLKKCIVHVFYVTKQSGLKRKLPCNSNYTKVFEKKSWRGQRCVKG